MNILIRNLKEMPLRYKLGPMDVYIGRHSTSHGLQASALANPIRLEDESKRDEVLRLYKRWLWLKMQDENSIQSKELLRIMRLSEKGAVTLWCWCAPKPCHGEIIKAAVEWMKGGSR